MKTNRTNKNKPKSVYLPSDFTANQKLHRIYFVQGGKPFTYLEYKPYSCSQFCVDQISSNLCFK